VKENTPAFSQRPSVEAGAEIDLQGLIGYVLDKIWLVGAVTLAVLILGSVIVATLPNQYLAKTLLLLETPSKEAYLGAEEYKDLVLLPTPPQIQIFYNTQIELMRGSATTRRVIDRLQEDLEKEENKSSFSRFFKTLSRNLPIGGLYDTASNGERTELLSRLGKDLKIQRIYQTSLVEITLKLANPVLAAKITNTVAEVYIEQYQSELLSMTRKLAELILKEGNGIDANSGPPYQLLQRMFGADQKSVIGRLRLRREEFQGRLDNLSLYYKEGHPEIVTIAQRLQELDEEINQEIENAIERWKGSSLGAEYLVGKARIAEYAQVPKMPVGPKRIQAFAACFFLAIGSGFGVVIFLYQWDPRIKTEEELIRATALTCLGVFPKVDSRVSLDRFSQMSPELKDLFAYLRTAILFSMPEEKSQAILLTSALRGEGRTTMAANLASSLALDGLETVLVDGDTREPRIHEIFSLHKTPGLTNFLNGEVALEAILHRSNVQNLTVIPVGDPVPNPSELLSSTKMTDLIKELRRRFKKVIVDSPPVMNMADGMILSSLVDGVVLVVSAQKSNKQMLKKIKDHFQQMHDRMIGAVLNRFDVSRYGTPLEEILFKFTAKTKKRSAKLVPTAGPGGAGPK